MISDINLLVETANALVTIGCGIAILFLVLRGTLERHLFYYGWSIGFFLYGLYVLIRPFFPVAIADIPMAIAFLIFFPITLFVLQPRRYTLILVAFITIVAVIFAGFWLQGYLQINVMFWDLSSVFFYLPVVSVLIVHRKLFGSSVDKFLIGWISLFLVNVLFPLDGWVTDALALLCKLIIIAGIQDYDFALATQRIRKGLSENTPSPVGTFGDEDDTGLELVMLNLKKEDTLTLVTDWIKEKVDTNIRQNIETTVIILQDVLPYKTIRTIVWKKPDIIHVFLFSQNPADGTTEFSTLRYGAAEIGATITEVARSASSQARKNEILVVDLSIMINTLGVIQTYELLLSKMRLLRSNNMSLIALFYPEIHEDKTVALFKSISSHTFQLNGR